MKRIIINLFIIATTVTAQSQIKTPAPSPKSMLQQTVGLTDVTIEYSRPSIKGRTIFDNLVPYGKVWRTGANENTKITFTDDVIIDGKTLKKGTYALYTKPNSSNWDVMFYTDTENWGVPKQWDANKVALKTTVKTRNRPTKIETFTINIDDITYKSGVIGLEWENTYAGIQFTVPTETLVNNSINKVMAGPSAADYYNAAVYYLNSNNDINKAKEWIDKAVEMTRKKPKFWYVHQQALIYQKAGDMEGAKKAAKHSLKLAKEANYDAYIKKNEDLLKTL